jgi:hypothetical protein
VNWMKWRYLIPHQWPSGSRKPWAEAWLLPTDGRLEGKSVAITIDALGDSKNPAHGDDRVAFQEDARKKLARMSYYINGPEMIVDATDFNLSEFLGWVKVWIGSFHREPVELESGELKEFLGTNVAASTLERLIREYPKSSGIEDLDG